MTQQVTRPRTGRPRVGTTVQLRVPDDLIRAADAEAGHRRQAGKSHAASTRAAVLRDWLLRGAPPINHDPLP